MQPKAPSKRSRKESRALLVGAVCYLFMAVLAWVTYYLSNSEVILLDGNYSFILFIGVLVALKIAAIKDRKTKTFPLGQFFYESLYGFIKGLMILGVLLMSVVTAIARILMYYTGSAANIPRLVPDPILVYALLCGIICFGVSFFHHQQNASIGNRSILLMTEQKAAFVDGTLSTGIAAGIFFVTRGGIGGGEFGPYLADSFFVLILAGFLIKEPVSIIKESLIELAGGTLQDDNKRETFEQAVYSSIPETMQVEDIFVSKNGSQYVLLVYVSTSEAAYLKKDILSARDKILEKLSKEHPYLSLDLIPEGKPAIE